MPRYKKFFILHLIRSHPGVWRFLYFIINQQSSQSIRKIFWKNVRKFLKEFFFSILELGWKVYQVAPIFTTYYKVVVIRREIYWLQKMRPNIFLIFVFHRNLLFLFLKFCICWCLLYVLIVAYIKHV